jgi:transketolase
VKARVAIEQPSTFRWERYVGTTGRIIGMHTFGASAPLKEPQKQFGSEPNQIVTAAKRTAGDQRVIIASGYPMNLDLICTDGT